jgi:hypothetical protein
MDWMWLTFRPGISSKSSSDWTNGGRPKHDELTRYVKQVDADEATVRFYQEVFDGDGRLRDVHEKFPVDLGHRKMMDEES